MRNDQFPTMEHFIVQQQRPDLFVAFYCKPLEPVSQLTHAEAYRAGVAKREFQPLGYGDTPMLAIAELARELDREQRERAAALPGTGSLAGG